MTSPEGNQEYPGEAPPKRYCVYLVGDALEPARSALQADFAVESFSHAQPALERVRARRPDLLVIDEDLPDMPGTALFKLLRAEEDGRQVPAILISNGKTRQNAEQAFLLGADDHLARPFDPRELKARFRAVLRRRFERRKRGDGVLKAGDMELEPSERRCAIGGKALKLRPLEFAVLEVLMRKAGRVLSRDYLLEAVWNGRTDLNKRVVDTVLSRLRKALGQHGDRIETVSKLGYRLRASR